MLACVRVTQDCGATARNPTSCLPATPAQRAASACVRMALLSWGENFFARAEDAFLVRLFLAKAAWTGFSQLVVERFNTNARL